MGQIASIDNGTPTPIFVSPRLKLNKIEINPYGKSKLLKTLVTNHDTNNIILPKSPLSEFTQNKAINEWPFLLHVETNDQITFHLSVSDDLLSKFSNLTTDRFTMISNIRVLYYDGSKDLVDDHYIASRLEIVNHGRTTVDPKIFQISTDSNHFELSLNVANLTKHGRVYVSILGDNEELIKFPFFLKESTTKAPQDIPSYFYDPQLNFIGDGPIFKSNISRIEEFLQDFKSLLKNVIKKSQLLDEATRDLAIARSSLNASLAELINLKSPFENHLLTDLINDLIPSLTEKSTKEIEESNNISKHLITPLTLFYNTELKSLAVRKKQYSEDSQSFYEWLSDEMLDKESESEEVAKHELFKKRLDFELKRFNYYYYLNDFRNGYLMRNILYNISSYIRHISPSGLPGGTEFDIAKANYYYNNYKNFKKDQEKARNFISSTKSLDELSKKLSTSFEKIENVFPVEVSSPPTPISKESKKTGVLYTLGGKNKAGWHKQLISLKNNTLSEYTDWKEGQKLRCAPLDVTFASIQKVEVKERRYCFEIITPNNVKRIFEADSEDDRDQWLKALNTASRVKDDGVHFNREAVLTMQRSKDDMDLTLNNNLRRIAFIKNAAYNQDDSLDSFPDLAHSAPLIIVQRVDPSNRICCDCGTLKDVEWLSLNLLVCVCLECSEVHRTLGSKISKISSLVFDILTFETPEVRELLYHVSNKFSNAYWESNLSPKDKLTPLATAEKRTLFINQKYVEKKFLQPEPRFKPNDALIKGIRSSNVALMLKALAYGADLEAPVVKHKGDLRFEVSLFEYSLSYYHGLSTEPVFDLSQLLLFWNVPCDDKIENVLPLNEKQMNYWRSKVAAEINNNRRNAPLPPVHSPFLADPITKAKRSNSLPSSVEPRTSLLRMRSSASSLKKSVRLKLREIKEEVNEDTSKLSNVNKLSLFGNFKINEA